MLNIKVVVPLLALLLPAGLLAQPAEPTADVAAEVVSAGQQAPAEEARLQLEALVQEALENNPGVQSALRRVEAWRRRVPQARSFPDPVLGVGWMGEIRPFSLMRNDPSSFRSITAKQKIPFPGKLKLRGQIAGREAEAAWWDYETIRRRVAAQVKVTYYDYFYYHQAIEITRKDKDLLGKLAQIAVVRYQVGKGIQQDVLRAQVELSRILQRLTVLEQQEKTAQVRLNTLLYRQPDAPLPPPAALEQSQLTYSLESLYQLARENDTGLQREQQMIERNQLAVNLARKEFYPDLSIAYMYQNRPLMQEMHGVTFSINIPVFYKSKQREGVNEATLELLSARRSRDNRETLLSFEVKQHYLAAKAADELARLYSQAIVPQSSLALDSALAAYEVGSVDFLTVLDSFITVLDYEINYYRELSNYQIALARLEPLVSVPLTN
ncbi:MAG: TolC family protein [Acidobacteria bacterium]|nr:TolC family protein [Acidobacteriota bacterium]